MPRFDGTGPRGEGPMTGRGMGYCVVDLGRKTVQAVGNFVARGFGWGFGRGRGRGVARGFGRGGGRGFGFRRFWR